MGSEEFNTVLIRAGFKANCIPAGIAEASVSGEMLVEDAEDAALMLEMTARNIRRQLEMRTTQLDRALEIADREWKAEEQGIVPESK